MPAPRGSRPGRPSTPPPESRRSDGRSLVGFHLTATAVPSPPVGPAVRAAPSNRPSSSWSSFSHREGRAPTASGPSRSHRPTTWSPAATATAPAPSSSRPPWTSPKRALSRQHPASLDRRQHHRRPGPRDRPHPPRLLRLTLTDHQGPATRRSPGRKRCRQAGDASAAGSRSVPPPKGRKTVRLARNQAPSILWKMSS